MAASSQPLIHSPASPGSAEPERLWRRGKEVLFRHVSILNWLPRYTREDAMGDLVAGVTLGLTMMPQGIAYASLAGLTAQYGLYSSFMGGLVYMVFGTIKEVSIGITSLMSLMTFEYTHDLPVEFVFLLTFLTGCLQLVMGCLNLGILVDFISMPVTSGFTTATSLIIIGSQLKGLLGLSFKARSFIDNVTAVIAHAGETRLWDAVLGVVCILVLLLTRDFITVFDNDRFNCFITVFGLVNSFSVTVAIIIEVSVFTWITLLKNIHLGPKEAMKQTCIQRIVNKSLWFLCIARNAIVVVACSALAYRFTQSGTSPFQLSGTIQPGLPPFGLPPFTVQFNNRTYSFLDMCKQLGSGIFVTPIISVLANVGIAKAFAAGKSLDATQEMLTLGLCNVLGSLVQSTPTTGAFTRSAVSHASGVKTPMAGLYSATLILLALSYLTPYFYYIPKAVLSAVLIAAVVFMVDYQTMVLLWKKSKRDLLLLLITLAISLVLSVEVGLLVGTLFNAGCSPSVVLYVYLPAERDLLLLLITLAISLVLSVEVGLLVGTLFNAGCSPSVVLYVYLPAERDLLLLLITLAISLVLSVEVGLLVGTLFNAGCSPSVVLYVYLPAERDLLLLLIPLAISLVLSVEVGLLVGTLFNAGCSPSVVLYVYLPAERDLLLLLITLAISLVLSVEVGLLVGTLFNAGCSPSVVLYVYLPAERDLLLLLITLAISLVLSVEVGLLVGTLFNAGCSPSVVLYVYLPAERDLLLLLITLAISLVLSVEVGLLVGTLFNAGCSPSVVLYVYLPAERDLLLLLITLAISLVLSVEVGLLVGTLFNAGCSPSVVLYVYLPAERDLLLLLITLAISLVLSVEVGLLVGTLFNAAHLLYAWARPSMDVKMCKTQQGLQYVMVSPDLGLLYPAMDYLKTELGSVATNQGRGQLPVALNCASFKGIDYSAAQGLKLIVKHFKINEQPFILLNAQPRVRAFLHSNDVSGALYADSEDEIAEVLYEWSAEQQESPQCDGADTKVACESELQDYRLQLEREKPAP